MVFDYGKEPWDKQDKKYLKKLIEKQLSENDGKVPAKQLYEGDYLKFDGVNLQGHVRDAPASDEQTIALYMIDLDQGISKRFTVTQAMLMLMARKTGRIIYGTSDPDGHQTKVILQWEKELRLYPTSIPNGDKKTMSDNRYYQNSR